MEKRFIEVQSFRTNLSVKETALASPPYPARFSVSLSSECDDGIVKFLARCKVFTFNQYNEQFQIPFTCTPTALGQFQAHIMVALLGLDERTARLRPSGGCTRS
jgi:hypothetical protein